MGIFLTQSPEELRSAFEVQSHSELGTISLLECSAIRNEGPLPEELALDVTHSASWAIVHRTLRVTVEVRMRATAKEEFLSITARYLVEYKLTKDYEPVDQALDAFSNGNAVFNVWPFARELFASLTSRMGLQLPPLPFLRVVPESKKVPESGATRTETPPKSTARRPRTARKIQ